MLQRKQLIKLGGSEWKRSMAGWTATPRTWRFSHSSAHSKISERKSDFQFAFLAISYILAASIFWNILLVVPGKHVIQLPVTAKLKGIFHNGTQFWEFLITSYSDQENEIRCTFISSICSLQCRHAGAVFAQNTLQYPDYISTQRWRWRLISNASKICL